LRAFSQCDFDWKPGQGCPGLDGTVYAVTARDPDGAGPQPQLLVAGGKFQVAWNVSASNIAVWDGNSWQHALIKNENISKVINCRFCRLAVAGIYPPQVDGDDS
jgi:hypothetical protein